MVTGGFIGTTMKGLVRNTAHWNLWKQRGFELLFFIAPSLFGSARELRIVILRGGNSGGKYQLA